MNEELNSSRDVHNAEPIEVEAICLERWGAVPSSALEEEYRISPPQESMTDLSLAVSQLYEDATFQGLPDNEKQDVLQQLVWLVNDRWMGWRTSSHHKIIANAVRSTEAAAELDYNYAIQIGDEVLADSPVLDGYVFPVDMLRVRNHLCAGEMVVTLSKTGIVGVAYATDERRVLAIIELPVDREALKQHYEKLVQIAREIHELETQKEILDELIQRLKASGFSNPTEEKFMSDDDSDSLDTAANALGLLERFSQPENRILQTYEDLKQMYGEFSEVLHLYSEEAALALFDWVERHQSQVDGILDAEGKIPNRTSQSLVDLSRRYQGDLERLRENGATAFADLLGPAQLLRQISLCICPFPSHVLVKISESLGDIRLQTAYDCFHKAGIKGFEQPVKFLVLQTKEPDYLYTHIDTDQASATDSLVGQSGTADLNDPSTASLIAAFEDSISDEDAFILATRLAKHGPDGIQYLIEIVDHDCETFRNAAMLALNVVGSQALPQLLEALRSRNEQRRLHISAILTSIGEPVLKPLLSTLTTEDVYQRTGAMMALTTFENQYASVPWSAIQETTIRQIVNDLSYPDEDIQNAVLAFFAGLGSQAKFAVEPLIELMASPSEEITLKAGAAFVMMGESAKVPLENLLRTGNTRQRTMALIALDLIEKSTKNR